MSTERAAQMPAVRTSLAALIVSLLLTSASQAQLAETKIASTSERAGNSEVYVMNADGSNPVNLTNRPANDFFPS